MKLSTLAKKVRITSDYGAVEVPEGWPSGTRPYKVTLRYRGRRMTVPFFMGPAHTSEPAAAGVLSCLLSDASADGQSFEEWACDLGYDADSRKAERTYKACVESAAKLRRLLGADFDTFRNAENDL